MNITSLTRSSHHRSGDQAAHERLVNAAATPNSARRRLVGLGAALTLAGATFLSVAPTIAGASEDPAGAEVPSATVDTPPPGALADPGESATSGGDTGGSDGQTTGGTDGQATDGLIPSSSGGDTGDTGGTDGDTTGGTDGHATDGLIPSSSGGDSGGSTDGERPECERYPDNPECPPPECPEVKRPDRPKRPVERKHPDIEHRLIVDDDAERPERVGVPDDYRPETDVPTPTGHPKHPPRPERPQYEDCDEPDIPEIPEDPTPTVPDVVVDVQVDRPVLASPNFTG